MLLSLKKQLLCKKGWGQWQGAGLLVAWEGLSAQSGQAGAGHNKVLAGQSPEAVTHRDTLPPLCEAPGWSVLPRAAWGLSYTVFLGMALTERKKRGEIPKQKPQQVNWCHETTSISW